MTLTAQQIRSPSCFQRDYKILHVFLHNTCCFRTQLPKMFSDGLHLVHLFLAAKVWSFEAKFLKRSFNFRWNSCDWQRSSHNVHSNEFPDVILDQSDGRTRGWLLVLNNWPCDCEFVKIETKRRYFQPPYC